MTVKIARLRSREDVIADFKEVFGPEDEQGNKRPIAYAMRLPYEIRVLEIDMNQDHKGSIRKVSEPELFFAPWAPLSKEKDIFLRMEEVISLYDPHDAVMEKYTEITKVHQDGQRENPAPEERGTD
jgi:hypothetical protein